MARKRYNEEDVLRLLREIEVNLHGGMDVVSACHTAPFPTPSLQKNRKACPAPRSGRLACFSVGALAQPLPVDIHPKPRPVMSLTAEALGLRCKVLGLLGWNTALMHHDGHTLLKDFAVGGKARVNFCCIAHGIAP